MARTIEVSIDIPAEAADVWAALERIEDHPTWMADAESIRFHDGQRRGVGTRFVCRTRVGPLALDDRMEVTQWSPGAAIAVRHHGIVSGFGVFTLHPHGPTSTRLVWSESLRAPWWLGGGIGTRVATAVLARIWRANLRRFAAQLAAGLRATNQTIASGGTSRTTEHG